MPRAVRNAQEIKLRRLHAAKAGHLERTAITRPAGQVLPRQSWGRHRVKEPHGKGSGLATSTQSLQPGSTARTTRERLPRAADRETEDGQGDVARGARGHSQRRASERASTTERERDDPLGSRACSRPRGPTPVPEPPRHRCSLQEKELPKVSENCKGGAGAHYVF